MRKLYVRSITGATVSKRDKSAIWMPLYVSDWDDSTSHLDCEQDGAYGRLVRHYWKSGPPPDDDRSLSCIVRMDLGRWKKIRPSIAPFFQIQDGCWVHERVEEELQRSSELIQKRREAGSKGGRPRKPNGSDLLSKNVDFEKQKKPHALVTVDVTDSSESSCLSQKLSSDSQDRATTGEVIALAERLAR